MLAPKSVSPFCPLFPGLYYGITIAIVSFATVMTVFVLNIHYKGSRGRQVPKLLKKICFGFIAKLLFLSLDMDDPPPDHKHAAGTKGMVSRGRGNNS